MEHPPGKLFFRTCISEVTETDDKKRYKHRERLGWKTLADGDKVWRLL